MAKTQIEESNDGEGKYLHLDVLPPAMPPLFRAYADRENEWFVAKSKEIDETINKIRRQKDE